MKRWFFITLAALIVTLSYPSTHALADTAKQTDTSKPRILTPLPGTGPIVLAGGGDGDGDGGDSDGLAGNSKSNPYNGPDPASGLRMLVQVWWKFMIWLR